ncbi:MAG: glutamate--tRNA ligase [Chloroflexi bacterium]|nr:glutamate--tRNA ligase [Chloroflexota bacterium]
MTTEKPYRVRFAPSPTGHVHLGSARTALFDYLIAQKTGGQFILRIEDTDRKRLVEGAEQELVDSLKWLGIQYDEGPDVGGPYGPYRQSERKEIYLKHANELIELEKAYPCFCSPERLAQVRQEKQNQKLLPHYDGLCQKIPNQEAKQRMDSGESYVIRFKSPKEGTTIVKDLLRGEIVFDNKNLDDFILVKSDGWALYHLAAIVDDYLMKITHVIRGSEWLPTSPLHSLIWKAFGWEEPVWVHLSVFLKPSGKGKMSKREVAQLSHDGYSIFIKDLKELGYLPSAVNNWIALMGWSFDDHTEYFTMQDLIEKFSLEKLNPSPAAINFSKLDHFNKLHIKALSNRELAESVKPFFDAYGIQADLEKLSQLAPVINERLVTLDDAVDFCAFIFKDKIEINKESLSIADKSEFEIHQVADDVFKLLENTETWDLPSLEEPLKEYMEKRGLSPKDFYGFLREAISGQRVTPPLFESMAVLGRGKTLDRISAARSLFI